MGFPDTSSIKAEFESHGYTATSSEIYQHDQTKFLKSTIAKADKTESTSIIQYLTLYNKLAINITIRSYSDGIKEDEAKLAEAVIDGVSFGAEPQKAGRETEYASSHQYSDPDSEISFTLPDGWIEEPVNVDNESLDAQFNSQEEDGLMIIYGSTDIWTQTLEMTGVSADALGFIRSDFDNHLFTASNIAEIYGIDESEVMTIQYNDLDFYIVETDAQKFNPNASLYVMSTFAITIHNGYMYLFAFVGTDESTFYEDFEFILSSVQFE